MKINWKVRICNKTFWISLIPAVLLLIQLVADVFGFSVEFSELGSKLVSVVNALFVVLSIMGVVNDPTTKGVSDSEQAMTYEKPKE